MGIEQSRHNVKDMVGVIQNMVCIYVDKICSRKWQIGNCINVCWFSGFVYSFSVFCVNWIFFKNSSESDWSNI